MGWGAIASAALQVGSQIFGAASQGNMNRKNRQFTAEQNAINRQTTWDMWNGTNDFNLKTSDPAFIMQRLKNAGMNPWLAIGNPQEVKASNMGTDQSAPPPGQPSKLSLQEAYQAFMQARLQEKQLQLVDSQIENQKADTNLKETNAQQSAVTANSIVQDTNQKAQLFGGQIIGQSLDNQFKGIMNGYQQNASNKLLKEIESIGLGMNKTQQEIQNLKQNVAESLIRVQNLVKEGKLTDAKIEAENMINNVTRDTMGTKIEAENAKNRLLRDTNGLSDKTLTNLPAVMLGHFERLGDLIIESVKKKRKSKLKQ